MIEDIIILIMKFKENNCDSILIRIEEVGLRMQKEINQSKDLMIASLNHDIKNPILSTITVVEYLKEGWLNNK